MAKFQIRALYYINQGYERSRQEEILPAFGLDYVRSIFSERKFRLKPVSEFFAKIQGILLELEPLGLDVVIPQNYIKRLETIVSEHPDEHEKWPCSSIQAYLEEHQLTLQAEAKEAEKASRTYSAKALLSSEPSLAALDEKKYEEEKAVDLPSRQVVITCKLLSRKPEMPKQDGIQFTLKTSDATYQVSTYNYRLRQVDSIKFVATNDCAFIAIEQHREKRMSGFSNFTLYSDKADLYRWDYKSKNPENIKRLQFRDTSQKVDYICSLQFLPGRESLIVTTREQYKQDYDVRIVNIASGGVATYSTFSYALPVIYAISSHEFMCIANTAKDPVYPYQVIPVDSFEGGSRMIDSLPGTHFSGVQGIHYQNALKQVVVLCGRQEATSLAFHKPGEKEYTFLRLFPGTLTRSFLFRDRYIVNYAEINNRAEQSHFIDIIDGEKRTVAARIVCDLDADKANEEWVFEKIAKHHAVLFPRFEKPKQVADSPSQKDKNEEAERGDYELSVQIK